jgi:ubiquinone/menaquinone biosynthesis C-methylase UbiE
VSSRDDTYTHGHHDSVLRSHRWRTAENSAAYLLPHLRPGLGLLDIGCGPGTITLDLARLVAPGRVLGIDREEGVLGEARELAAGVENLSFAAADVYALDFADGSFDVVHAHQVLQHLADPVAALREMRRVCRPGGIVAARDGDYGTFVWHPADPVLDRWLELYHAVARANRAEPDAARWLLAWAHAAGFEDVAASASAWCWSTPDERAWWSSSWRDRITASAFAEQALAYGLATREELEEIAAAFGRWAESEDAWWALLHGEIVCRA